MIMNNKKYSVIAVASISVFSLSILNAQAQNKADVFDCFKALNLPLAQNNELLKIKNSNLTQSDKQEKIREFAKNNLNNSQKMQVKSCAQASK